MRNYLDVILAIAMTVWCVAVIVGGSTIAFTTGWGMRAFMPALILGFTPYFVCAWCER